MPSLEIDYTFRAFPNRVEFRTTTGMLLGTVWLNSRQVLFEDFDPLVIPFLSLERIRKEALDALDTQVAEGRAPESSLWDHLCGK